jgi:hypothetical protein
MPNFDKIPESIPFKTEPGLLFLNKTTTQNAQYD